jgi:SAM-dependent methyltransferase
VSGEPWPFDPGEYGRHIGALYDSLVDAAFPTDTDATVALLAELADGGPVLEFGVGTGRLALPLARLGLAVSGIDGSAEMLDQLRKKPGGAAMPLRVGNFADTRLDGDFALVVLAANTIFALPSQDAQVQAFRNAAAHLRPGGHFVLEAWVPDLGDFRAGRALRIVSVQDRRVVLEAAELDPVEQHMRTTKLFCGPDGLQAFPANHRYAWPAELDLMAWLAELNRVHRWASWRRDPYTATSRQHVSVYRKDAP